MRCDNSLCGSEMVRAGTHWRCMVCGNAIQAEQGLMGESSRRERPPLGVIPEFIWKEKRIDDLRGAINRYMDGGYWPLPEWLREMADLVGWASDRKPKPFVLMHNEERRPDLEDIGTQGSGAATKDKVVIEGTIHFEGPEDREEIDEFVQEWVSETEGSIRPVEASLAGKSHEDEASLTPYDQAFQEGLEEEMSRMASRLVANPYGPADVESYPVPTENRPPPDRTYIQPRQYPTSRADAGWEEWQAMCARVDASRFRPWWEERAGWCVRTVTGKVDVIGKHHLSMQEAYEVAARQIDIARNTPPRENCP
jgi:hypothetical protein